MATLKTLVEALNTELHSMVGIQVSSALEVCTTVRDNIMSGKLSATVSEARDMIAFRDDIEDLQYIFLKTTPSELKKIIKINVGISYFNDFETEAGGILSSLNCELIGIGAEMKDASLAELIAAARLAEVKRERNEAKQTAEKYSALLAELEQKIQSFDQEEAALMAQLDSTKKPNAMPTANKIV